MSDRRFYTIAFIIFIVNGLMLSLLWQNHRLPRIVHGALIDESPLLYGDTAPVFSKKDTVGRWIDLSSRRYRYKLLVFFDPRITDGRIQYLDVLYNRYQNQGLLIVGISGGREDQAKSFVASSGVMFPVICDSDYSIHRLYRIHPDHGHGGTVLIDENLRVIFFKLGSLTNDFARQLVEGQLQVQVSYAVFTSDPNIFFRKGSLFPSLAVIDPDTGETFLLDGSNLRNSLVVIHLSPCSSCGKDKYLSDLKSLDATRERAKSITYLFGRNFTTQDLKYYGEMLDGKLFRLTDEVPGLENAYATRYSKNLQTVLVETDKQGKIISVNQRGGERR